MDFASWSPSVRTQTLYRAPMKSWAKKRRTMKPLIQFKKAVATFLALALVWFGLSTTGQAVNPPPDGGYANQNTAEGTDALLRLTSGVWNTAVGFGALANNRIGNQNTATGYKALFSNSTGDKSV